MRDSGAMAVALFCLAVGAGGCKGLGAGAEHERTGAWTMSEFMISHWSFPKDEAQLKQFVADGFNTVIAVPEELPLCRQHGLRAILATDPETAKGFVGDPLVWGYFVLDEPARKKIPYKDVAAKTEPFHRMDLTRPAYVNLNELDDPKAFIEQVRPRVLSYDYYQWWAGEEPFYPLLEKYRKAALDAKIPLIVWAEAISMPGGGAVPPDNLAKLRCSVYSALAYGAKGIQWWGWRADNRDVATVNAELKRLGPELMKLRSVAVYHTDPIPGTQQLPKDHWIRTATAGLLIGVFKDEKDTDYALVVDAYIAHPDKAPPSHGVRVFRFDKDGMTTDVGRPIFLANSSAGNLEVFDERKGEWIEPIVVGPRGRNSVIVLNRNERLIRVKSPG